MRQKTAVFRGGGLLENAKNRAKKCHQMAPKRHQKGITYQFYGIFESDFPYLIFFCYIHFQKVHSDVVFKTRIF